MTVLAAPLINPTLAQQEELLALMLLMGVALIVISLVMMMRKRRHRVATEPTAREQLEQSRQKQRMRGDLEHLMVELEQLTKRFSAQLDAKSLQLEKLIDQADRRIDELKRLQDEASTGSARDPWSHRDAWANAPGSTAPSTDAQRSAAALSGPPQAPQQTQQQEDELTRNIYALADQGHAPPEIARQLDEHIGKVELILALRKA